MQKREEMLGKTRSQVWKKEDGVKAEVTAHALTKRHFISY